MRIDLLTDTSDFHFDGNLADDASTGERTRPKGNIDGPERVVGVWRTSVRSDILVRISDLDGTHVDVIRPLNQGDAKALERWLDECREKSGHEQVVASVIGQ